MRSVLRYVTSVPKEMIGAESNSGTMQASLGVEKNGDMQVFFGDITHLDKETNYMPENAFPNAGEMWFNKNSLWLSMFTRYIPDSEIIECEDYV